jgi:hypothetical protein
MTLTLAELKAIGENAMMDIPTLTLQGVPGLTYMAIVGTDADCSGRRHPCVAASVARRAAWAFAKDVICRGLSRVPSKAREASRVGGRAFVSNSHR